MSPRIRRLVCLVLGASEAYAMYRLHVLDSHFLALWVLGVQFGASVLTLVITEDK